MKFGGSSVANAERIASITDIIKNNLQEKPIVTSSALGKTTDLLIQAGKDALNNQLDLSVLKKHHQDTCKELGVNFQENCAELFDELESLLSGIQQIQEISPRSNDYLVSFGERLAVRIIAAYLNHTGIPARAFDSWEIGMLTNSAYGNAELLPDTYKKIQDHLGSLNNSYEFTPVITGYIGKSPVGSITTFGRGGSDLSATILGAALNAKEIQVWKDVSGLMTADPRIINNALPVEKVSYTEAAELAFFGAKVLHPLSMYPAMQAGIPVRVKNSYAPEESGTVICNDTCYAQGLVKSITSKRNITLIDIESLRLLGAHGFLAKVFNIFKKYEIVVDVLASSEVSISLTVEDSCRLEEAKKELEEFSHISVLHEHAIISLICDAQNSAKILEQVFARLAKKSLNPKMLSQGASKINISFIFEDNMVESVLKEMHDALIQLREK